MNDQETLLTLVTESTSDYIQRANRLYNLNLTTPNIVLVDKGTFAGKAYSKLWEIKYNIRLLKNNVSEFILNTVPHEVAHLVENKLYGKVTHRKNWKQIMNDFGVEKPMSYHTYDIKDCKR